jgi:hypothetical protein
VPHGDELPPGYSLHLLREGNILHNVITLTPQSTRRAPTTSTLLENNGACSFFKRLTFLMLQCFELFVNIKNIFYLEKKRDIRKQKGSKNDKNI